MTRIQCKQITHYTQLTGILRWADNVGTQHVCALVSLQQSLV